MSENRTNETRRRREYRHRGRSSQIPIYLGKQLRFFINESDWKVIPMAAIIAALVSMVIRNKMFLNMEGTLIGAFALTCVAIWNGCFNSIQSVCRERPIIKREHRSGMHISSYVTAHMIYQFLLCLVQTGVSVFVLKSLGVRFPEEGFVTRRMTIDIGITMLLISYASDMMSLFISSISRTTTSAMTIMPFVLIFQLVFSGGIIPLPAWSQGVANFTISNSGIRAITAQSGYNEQPMVAGWNMLKNMRNEKIEQTVTVERLLEILNSDVVKEHSEEIIIPALTAGQAAQLLGIEIGDEVKDQQLSEPVSVASLVEFVNKDEAIQQQKDKSFTIRTTVGKIIDLVGEDTLKEYVESKSAQASRKDIYDRTMRNIAENWIMLFVFILAFAAMSTISLELIDKDKR